MPDLMQGNCVGRLLGGRFHPAMNAESSDSDSVPSVDAPSVSDFGSPEAQHLKQQRRSARTHPGRKRNSKTNHQGDLLRSSGGRNFSGTNCNDYIRASKVMSSASTMRQMQNFSSQDNQYTMKTFARGFHKRMYSQITARRHLEAAVASAHSKTGAAMPLLAATGARSFRRAFECQLSC